MNAKQFVLVCTLASIAWAIISPSVANAVLVIISSEPASANLPGYTKWTFEIDPEGDTLTLWEATFTSDAMSQFYPNDGVMDFPTVFQNNNIRFSAPDQVAGLYTPADDSQFDSLSTVDTFFPTESSGPLDPVNPMPLGTLSQLKAASRCQRSSLWPILISRPIASSPMRSSLHLTATNFHFPAR